LLTRLICRAPYEAVERLFGDILLSNEPMRRLARAAGMRIAPTGDGLGLMRAQSHFTSPLHAIPCIGALAEGPRQRLPPLPLGRRRTDLLSCGETVVTIRTVSKNDLDQPLCDQSRPLLTFYLDHEFECLHDLFRVFLFKAYELEVTAHAAA
jgi:hypothetical protein